MAANTEYAVGTFDGARFTPEQSRLPGHRGRGFYAPQTFNDIPAKDGRRIQIGWFQTETRGMPFNQSMTVPLELRLTSTPEGPRIAYAPVRELEKLRRRVHRTRPTTLVPGGADPLAGVRGELVELRAEFEPGDAGITTFGIRGATVAYDARARELVVNGHRAPAPPRNGRQRITVLCDRTGLEVFASDGLCYVPMPYQPKPDDLSLSATVSGAPVRLGRLEVHELRSAWEKSGR
jgi:sucrose-6-phosphate hydrolase SacC (GH32 family)